jgi:hypothetical protein
MKSKIKILLPILSLGFALANFAQAALVQCGTRLKPVPCDLAGLINGVFVVINFLFGSVTLITIGYILYGGVRMILAAGDDGQIKIAKDTFRNAITGLIIVILAYLIVTSVTFYLTGVSFSDLRTKFFNFQ